MLADVIINGSAEELALSKLQRQVEEEVLKVQVQERHAGREISAEDASTRACENLRAFGLRSVQMETAGVSIRLSLAGFFGFDKGRSRA